MGGQKGYFFDVKYRFAIAVIAFALAFLPCAKVAYAWVGSGGPSSSGLAEIVAVTDTGFASAESPSERLCVKCCNKSKAVVHRVEPLAVPQISVYLPASDWFDEPGRPTGAAVLMRLGARGPPPPHAGTAYKAIFAKTSRFLT